MRRIAPVVMAVIGLHLAGCQGCNETPAPPLPVARDGKLPQAPSAVTSPVPTANSEPACVAILTPDVEEGPAPLTVHFTAEGMCTDNDGEYTWDFGDGSPGPQGTTTVHVYDKPGDYTARVTLTDKTNNVSDSDDAPITVTAP